MNELARTGIHQIFNSFAPRIYKVLEKHEICYSHSCGHLDYSLSPGFLAEFYFNRGLQRLYTGTCIILQKNN